MTPCLLSKRTVPTTIPMKMIREKKTIVNIAPPERGYFSLN